MSKKSFLQHPGIWYALVLATSLFLYVATCAPRVVWHDSGLLSWRILEHDFAGDMGLALAHPLYILIGLLFKAVPLGDMGYRFNLLSALFGAVTVANLFLLVKIYTRRLFPAVLSALSLALAWTFWWHCVLAEVYTLQTAIITAELLALLCYFRSSKPGFLYALFFLNGLAISNHMWGTFGLFCFGLLILWLLWKRRIPGGQFILCLLVWTAGFSLYGYFILQELMQTGDPVGTIKSVFFGRLWENTVLNTSMNLRIAVENIAFIGLNFPTPNFLLIPLGIVVMIRQRSHPAFTLIMLILSVMYFLFAFRYTVADRYAFFMPLYIFMAFFIGPGAAALLDWIQKKGISLRAAVIVLLLLAVLPVGVYAAAPVMARKLYPALAERRQRPYRDEYTYFLRPWKTGYDGAWRFCTESLEIAAPDGVIFADATVVHTLMFVQETQGRYPDVKIVSNFYHTPNAPDFNEQTFKALLDRYDIYVVSAERGYCPDYILNDYRTLPRGVLYKVEKPR